MKHRMPPHVLSIQSHVVHGYVGNKCVCFPLQVMGFEVDTINSVQFSNHTGYGVIKGQRLDSKDLGELYSGLKENRINTYSHIITGYVGSVSFLEKLADIIKDVKLANKGATYVCDPVMGDNGAFYVPEELAEVYKKIIPLADILTPNQFELQVLTGLPVDTEAEAIRAIDSLHDLGIPTVILTSAKFNHSNKISCIGSRRKDGVRFRIDIPFLDAIFTGTGDLFAASTLAWTTTESKLDVALTRVVSTVQAVIKDTYETYKKINEGQSDLPTAARIELRIIQNKSVFEDPPNDVTAVNIP